MQLPVSAALSGSALFCLCLSPNVLAQDVTALDAVVVTADRKARSIANTLAPVTVLTRADIERQQALSLPEVLQRTPGISMNNSGGLGKATSVFLRGTNSTHALVLVDGMPVGSATTGSVAWQDLPLEHIERIEIVRGPRSSLYGSEAIGGVIQIFTRNGGDASKGLHPEVSLSAGSHNTQQASLNLGGGNAKAWYNLGVATQKTDGINATSNNAEPDQDGYERNSLALRAGSQLGESTTAELSLLQAEGSNDYDGSFVNQSDFTQRAATANLRHELGERLAVSARLGQSQDDSDNFKNGTFRTRFNTQREQASVQADMGLGANSNLTLGVDQQTDKVDSTTAYTVKSRDNTGVFAALQSGLGATHLEVAARNDDNEQFGTHTTGSVAIGRDFGENLRVTASHGTAFKAPTFNQLYFPGFGDATLKPEESANSEIGFSGKALDNKLRWSANAFSNEIENLISYPPPTFAVQQTDKARIQGVELAANTAVGAWDVDTNLTLQNPENRSGADAGKKLVYRPQQLANLGVSRQVNDKLRVGLNLHGEGKRYGDAANTESRKLGGFATLDVNADYQVAKQWQVGVKLNNLLDKDYQTNSGYNQDGINGLVTLKYAPQ